MQKYTKSLNGLLDSTFFDQKTLIMLMIALHVDQCQRTNIGLMGIHK